MSAQLNRYLFEQTRYDSGSLTQLGFVVHQYTKPGRYKIDVFRLGQFLQTLNLTVDANANDKQLSLDLANLDAPAHDHCECKKSSDAYLLDKDGYAVFYTGSGSGGFSVKSYFLTGKEPELVFDSQHLNKDDLFGITLIRPGIYKLENAEKKISSVISVLPVKPGKTRYLPPDAVHLELDKLKALKDGISVQQAQGLVFRASGNDRFVIELAETPEEKQSAGKVAVARWTKASAKRNKE